MLTFASTTQAETIALWHFDEGPVSNNASTLSSVYNPVIMEATAGSNGGGPIPFFDDDIGVSYIKEGTNATAIHANKFSLKFTNSGLPANTNSHSGGILTVPHNGILLLSNLTAEAFIKVDRRVNYPLVIGKSRSDGNGTSWSIDFDSTGKPRVRIDCQPIGSTSSALGYNKSFTSSVAVEDGQWHHLAFTYQHDIKKVRLYVDYTERASGTTISNLVYQSNELRIGQGAGGRAFDGWIDEVRISDEVLLPQDFMTQHLYPTGTMILVF